MGALFASYTIMPTNIQKFPFLAYEACGILDPQPGIKPMHPCSESRVLTTGSPGKPIFPLKKKKKPTLWFQIEKLWSHFSTRQTVSVILNKLELG